MRERPPRRSVAQRPQRTSQPKEQADELSSEKIGKKFCEFSNQQMSIT
jgi:hypothetical protein